MNRFFKPAFVIASAGMLLAFANLQPGAAKADLSVVGETFVLTQPHGPTLTSRDLVGAEMDMKTPDGATITARIDAVTPSKESKRILLHRVSVKNPSTGKWASLCDADAYGRRAAFPVAGTFNGNRFVADHKQWFITCTSGSQGKCILWGYDPWKKGPPGEDLVPYYEACQHMVRADYDGKGAAHTKNGTMINVWDRIGIEAEDHQEKEMPFEAGWGPDGAVCVNKTRWPDLITTGELQHATPTLKGPCNEKIAAAKGALLFNRSR